MKALLITIALVATAPACGGPECSKSDRTGTYRGVLTEGPGGTCGAMPDVVVPMTDGSGPADPGCTIKAESWSADQCKNESTVECVSAPDNTRATATGVFTQQDGAGEVFDGVMTMTIKRLDTGATLCVSTYDVTYTRQ